jgi:sterol desaturase/sphingolipid hydroxylase (fatty acid hydroxylase superfamily)
MSLINRVFDKKGTPILAGIFVVLFIAESRRRLRKRKMPRWKRVKTNTVVAIPSFSLLRFLLLPVMVWLATKNKKLKWGINYTYKAHPLVKSFAAFLIMDYTNYVWHRLNHQIPFLWRFHLVHHTDVDLDISTAFRFHFGELIGSVFFRGGFVFLSGATPLTVLLYEILFEAETQFHHSNLKLPYKFENRLSQLIVTPRMHGIHHSNVKSETDSNYSVIFSAWDRIHNTLNLHKPQKEIVMGVPSYSNPAELTSGFLLKLPFTNIRPWKE